HEPGRLLLARLRPPRDRPLPRRVIQREHARAKAVGVLDAEEHRLLHRLARLLVELGRSLLAPERRVQELPVVEAVPPDLLSGQALHGADAGLAAFPALREALNHLER